MATIPANSSDWSQEQSREREQTLDQIIADYLEAHETGQPTDRDTLLKQYPALATELSCFFENQDRMTRLTAPFREVNQPALRAGWNPYLFRFRDLTMKTLNNALTNRYVRLASIISATMN